MDSNTVVKQMSGMEQISEGVPDNPDQIKAKNSYYLNGFHKIIWMANIQAIIILVLAAFLAFYVKTAKNNDGFFAETLEGRTMPMVGLELPNMGKIALANWVEEAATQIMTFGFNDIDQRFALSHLNFTPRGWKSFHEAMSNSGLIENVMNAQQIITSVPQSPAILLREGIIMGKYSWAFEMKLLITFRSGGVKQAYTRSVRVVVERVPTRDNPVGIGIGEWYIF